MKELTQFEVEQVGGGVVRAETIISATFLISPALAMAMAAGYYVNRQY